MKVLCSRLQEDSRHEKSVPQLVFNLANSERDLIFFQVFHILWRGSRLIDVNSSGLYFLLQRLFLSYHAASFTSRGAPVHLHFSGLPIDLWIMVLEPGEPRIMLCFPRLETARSVLSEWVL